MPALSKTSLKLFTLTTVIVMMNMMTKIRIVNMTRIRLIVSSTDISEEAELRLTSMLNETIKNYWVALGTDEKEDELVLIVIISGPRNYGKSIEWKLEGDPWVGNR